MLTYWRGEGGPESAKVMTFGEVEPAALIADAVQWLEKQTADSVVDISDVPVGLWEELTDAA
jgi:hypothetical protein